MLSLTEAAALLKMTRQALHEALQQGRLPGTRIGHQWVIKRSDVEAFRPRAYRGKREKGQP